MVRYCQPLFGQRVLEYAARMNFVVHFNFRSFSGVLKAGATAYLAVFSQPAVKPEESTGHVIITTDGGVEGGTVHALQITLLDKVTDAEKALEFAVEASNILIKSLKSRRVRTARGILSTAGLHESLQYWSDAARFSMAELTESLKTAKKKALG